MRADEKLTFYEGFCLLSLTFLYHVFNEVLPNLVSTTGSSSWISQIVSAVCSFGYLALIVLLFRMHKGMDFLQILDTVYGKYISKIMLIVLLAFLLFYAAVSLNQAVELLQIYAYSEISALEIDLLMMGAVSVFALYSIKGMAKTVAIVLPFIFATLLIILGLSHKQYDVHLLNPILGYGVKTTVFSGFMLMSEFNGLIVLGLFLNSYGSHKDFKRSSIWAIVASSALFIITTLCYNMAVPYDCAQDLMVGVLGIAQSNYTSRFVQRLESIFIAVTVMAIVLLLGISFLAIKKTYCHLFSINKKHSRAVIIPLAMIVVCLGRTMGNWLHFKNFARIAIRRHGIVLMLGLVVLTLLIAIIRRLGSKKSLRFGSLLLIPCLVAGLFSGCTHYREPDAEIYPIIMGYDKGETEQYRITMKFMLDSSSEEAKQAEQETSEPGGIPKDTVVMEAPSFTEGINMINASIPKKISLLHIKMLVISEEIAREGVDNFVAPLIHYNEIKPTMAFVVCRDSAYDFITSEQATLTDSLQLDMELVLETNKESTAYYVVSIGEFLYNYKSTYGDALAMLGGMNQSEYFLKRKEGESPAEHIQETPANFEKGFEAGELPIAGNSKMELAGMAVFRDDRMVGMLDTQECEVIMFLNNTLNTASFALPDLYDPENHYVSLQVRKVMPVRVKSWIDEDGIAHIDILSHLNASVGVSQNPKTAYMTNANEREALSQYLAESLKERAETLIKKTQMEYQSDILQLGRHVAGNFLTIQEWEAYDWSKQYRNAEITVNFNFNM